MFTLIKKTLVATLTALVAVIGVVMLIGFGISYAAGSAFDTSRTVTTCEKAGDAPLNCETKHFP